MGLEDIEKISETLTGSIRANRSDYPQEIAARIKTLIAERYYNPGDVLPSESKLSKIFGCGRSSVREAIKILIAENVIEIKKGIGTFVVEKPGLQKDPLGLRLIDSNRVLENLMETRLLIEPNIAFLAAERATEDNLIKLQNNINEAHKVLELNQNHTEVDMAFHNAIAEATKNEVIFRIIPIINDSIKAGYEKTVNSRDSFAKAIKFHEEVFNAIKNRDAEGAREALKCHLMQSIDDILMNKKSRKENE
ncbi:GntR family transcriptional regulator [[Clostridium] cellulosi]|mgnify:CR=1 FL=1|uniref:GntR family transcriptional regulator n=1 Tax=[Clostridium] cellulosi TaxID=29343 RepID=A0A078KRE1_9FIRM|nr:GntR family transcriptional regulator [[Clostridium] cellulosi]